ncbi:MAG: hypothetical protein ACRDBO_15810 [Lachnospiraceae bacterium]
MFDDYEIRPINPELAAHNIALAYVRSAAKSTKLFNGEDVILDDVKSLSGLYVDAYNYAYNYVASDNQAIEEAE